MDRPLPDYDSRRSSHRRPPPAREREYPRDGINRHKPSRNDDAHLDRLEWTHDRYHSDPETSANRHERTRGGGRRRDEDERIDDRNPPPAKLRVENLHYDLTEDDLWDLFNRIAHVTDVKLRYDRAGRSEGTAFVTYDLVADARAAIREFDGANAKGQPIRITLLPLPRRDNPFDRIEKPSRSLFERIEQPISRSRRRSQSPMDDVDADRRGPRGPRRGGAPRDRESARRSDISKPAPENIDRYIPRERDSRNSSQRGGRRPGERRERVAREPRDGDTRMANGRPRKTAEELDAEMDDYWGGANNGEASATTQAPAQPAATGGDDVDMIE